MFFVPTRGRPERLQRFLDACVDTGMTMQGMIMVDGRDGGDYSKVRLPSNWSIRTAPTRAEVCGRMEAMFHEFPDFSFYSIINDDIVPLTKGWDVKLAEAAGSWNVAYPDDCLNGARMATQFLVGGELCRAVGSFSLGFIHTQVDRAWMDIGRGINRLVFCRDVRLKHEHWSDPNNNVKKDTTYERMFQGKPTIPHDRARYDSFIKNDYVPLMQKLYSILQNRRAPGIETYA